MGIFLGRAVRAAIGALVWAAIALAMYAVLRALGSVSGPFDAAREFASIVAAIFKAASAVVRGAGLAGLWLLVPAVAGQEGWVVLTAIVVRAVEFIALAMGVAAVVRVVAVIFQGINYSRL